MNFGICNLSIIPIRKDPNDASEMVSQLLFGELFSIIKKEKKWLHIQCEFDEYEGWIDIKQAIEIERNIFESYQNAEKGISMEVVSAITNNSFHLPILIGSTLPYFDGMNFKLDKHKYIFNGQAIRHDNTNIDIEFIKKCAQKFLHAPYLWGGRSPFGIDCSGFVQIVFKLANIKLKRDAYQQAEAGQTIDLLEQTQIGDLAFFTNNDEERITHVGIIIETEQSVKIIHASGRVRIDLLDHYGIYNKETKNYSHKLKLIKRLL